MVLRDECRLVRQLKLLKRKVEVIGLTRGRDSPARAINSIPALSH